MSKRIIVTWSIVNLLWFASNAQDQPADSVVINVGQSSKVIFAIHKNDIETLKYYDFQALMNDMIKKLEDKDTSEVQTPSNEYLKV